MYDFAADSDKLESLASSLEACAGNVESCIGEIYGAIDSLDSYWNDESYVTFFNECLGFKSSLDTLVLILRAYAEILKGQTGGSCYSALESAVNAAFAAIG